MSMLEAKQEDSLYVGKAKRILRNRSFNPSRNDKDPSEDVYEVLMSLLYEIQVGIAKVGV